MVRLLAAAILLAGAASAEATTVTPLIARDLQGIPGKEGAMLVVDYPPGASDPIHRHNASVFVYVLEGSVVMQVRGRPAVKLGKGQTFFEGPNDVHVVGKNASNTEPAKFIAFFVKDKGVPPVLPAR